MHSKSPSLLANEVAEFTVDCQQHVYLFVWCVQFHEMELDSDMETMTSPQAFCKGRATQNLSDFTR